MISFLTRRLVFAILTCLFLAYPAAAKTASLSHPEGARVQINCNKKQCFVRHTKASGHNGKVHRAGPSTTYNFVRLVKLWQAKGYR